MFDWVFRLLYGISKSIYQLIDGVLGIAKKLCGLDSISIEGEETDFLTYLLSLDNVEMAFKVSAIVGLVLVVFFTVFQILRNVIKEKPEDSPARICGKALKNIMMFLFVPAVMIVLIWSMNTFMGVLNTATLGGKDQGIGQFLAEAFAGDCVKEGGFPDTFDYTDTSEVEQYCNLPDYNFFFSWVAGIAILVALAKSILMFVDRAFSIVILYIAAPISVSASILDDGARFKLWRDQVLIKFIIGYGTILGLNIYAIVVSAVAQNTVVFFTSSFLNFLTKIAIILGGALSLERLMGLIGNLVSSGAGTQEMAQASMAARSMGGMATGLARLGAKATGLSTLKDVVGGAWGNKKKEWSNRLSDKFSKKSTENKDGGGDAGKTKTDGGGGIDFGSNKKAEGAQRNSGNDQKDSKVERAIMGDNKKTPSTPEEKKDKSNGNHKALDFAITNGNSGKTKGGDRR